LLYVFLSFYATIGFTFLLEREYEKKNYPITIFNRHVRINIDFNAWKRVIVVILIFFGVGSPILTSFTTGIEVSRSIMNREFSDLAENQLIVKLLEDMNIDTVVATPIYDQGLSNYLPCFTGCYIVYRYTARPRTLPGLAEEIPSQQERINDLNILYANSSILDKIQVIQKYNIEYIVTADNEFLHKDLLFDNSVRTSFFGYHYYLFRLKEIY
jgi:uncharacterized membrane protein